LLETRCLCSLDPWHACPKVVLMTARLSLRLPAAFVSSRYSSRAFRSATLEHVVKELRKQGKLPGGEEPGYVQRSAPSAPREPFATAAAAAASSAEVVDIDADLLVDMPAHVFSREQEEEGHEAEEELDAHVAGLGDAEHEDNLISVSEERHEHVFEDVSLLSEEELRERVKRSIEELVPANLSTAGAGESSSSRFEFDSNQGLTPAQLFFKENRESLVNRAQDYYLEKQRERELQQEAVEDVEDEWRFYHDPVVRPRKGHLWSTGTEADGDEHGLEQDWLETVATWPQGFLPTVDMLVQLLRREQARDIQVVDLHACGRHDVGTHGIVASGVTTGHCRRLGEIAAKATQSLQVPHVEAFCYGTRNDEWVVAHCGPIKVHLLTRQCRELYKLELLWEKPEQFFEPGDFPHYLEIYGAASMAPESGHITTPSGSRSTRGLPAPFSDRLHGELTVPDYEAADDARYSSPTTVGDRPVAAVGSSRSTAGGAGGRRSGHDVLEMELLDDGSAVRAGGRAPARQPWPVDLDPEADTDDEDNEAAVSAPRRTATLPAERGKSSQGGADEPWDRL